MKGSLAAVALVLATMGCTSTHYEWGRYEDSVFLVTSTPDGFDLAAEIDLLELQVEKSLSKERPIPPGLHAHVGYLHAVAGNRAAAQLHFEREKALYPESEKFVQYLVSRVEMNP